MLTQLTIDWTVSIGNIASMVFVTIGVVSVFLSMRVDISALKFNLAEVKEEIKELKNVAVGLATQNTALQLSAQRMDRIQNQIAALEARMYDANVLEHIRRKP